LVEQAWAEENWRLASVQGRSGPQWKILDDAIERCRDLRSISFRTYSQLGRGASMRDA